jgi:hypothetical protein
MFQEILLKKLLLVEWLRNVAITGSIVGNQVLFSIEIYILFYADTFIELMNTCCSNSDL